jgi:hypothetical protein
MAPSWGRLLLLLLLSCGADTAAACASTAAATTLLLLLTCYCLTCFRALKTMCLGIKHLLFQPANKGQ